MNGGLPSQGTKITRSPSGPAPPDDYYFANSSPFDRSTVDSTLESTGVNGTALMVNSVLVDHSGEGGELPGCLWPPDLAKSVPGLVLVHEFHSIDSASGALCTSPLIFSDDFESGYTTAWPLTVPTPADFDWTPASPAIGEFVVFSISGLAALDSADWDFGGLGCGSFTQQYLCVPDVGDSCLQTVYRFAESGAMTVSLSVVSGGESHSPVVHTVDVDASGSCAK